MSGALFALGLGLTALGLIVFLTWRATNARRDAKEEKIDAEAAMRIAESEAHAPRTRDNAIAGLRDGKRKL